MADIDVAELRESLASRELEREALLSRLSLLETAYRELERELARERGGRTAEPARLIRPHTRLPRPASDSEPGDSPGVVLVATRLAREGHTRGEVESFLRENFCQVDVTTTVARAFGDAADPEPVET